MSVIPKMRSLISSMHAVYAIDLGVELGLFDRLAEQQPLPLNEFAEATEYPTSYVTSWMRAVQEAGVVSVDRRGIVSFQKGWKTALTDRESSEYIATLPRCHIAVAGAYNRFPALFREGKELAWQKLGKRFIDDVCADGLRFANFFITSVVDRIPELRQKLDSGATVYDVGCGSGHFTMKLVQAFPNSRFIGIDPWPEAIELAKAHVSERSLGDRVSFKTMCATELPKKSADVVIFNEVLHEMKEELRLPGLMAMRDSLKASGIFYIVDPLSPETHEDFLDEAADSHATTLFFETPLGSRLVTLNEMETLLKQAGFGSLHHLDSNDSVVAAYVKHNS